LLSICYFLKHLHIFLPGSLLLGFPPPRASFRVTAIGVVQKVVLLACRIVLNVEAFQRAGSDGFSGRGSFEVNQEILERSCRCIGISART
jgi:hypothetical protein